MAAVPRARRAGHLGLHATCPKPGTAKSGKGILWKTPVPLPGNNSPVVWGKRVFLSGADEKPPRGLLLRRRQRQAALAAGRARHAAEHGQAAEGQRRHRLCRRPRPPPTAAACSPFSPTATWPPSTSPASWPGRKSLGMPDNSYGHASSLATYKNLLLVQFDQGAPRGRRSRSCWRFDSATGKTVWQAARPVPNSWSTPIVIRARRPRPDHHGRPIRGSSPTIRPTAAELWRAKCLQHRHRPLARVCRRHGVRGQRQRRACRPSAPTARAT